jgi:hypothetical protein
MIPLISVNLKGMQEMSRSQESLEAENARLKGRITELESERFEEDVPAARRNRERSENFFGDVSSHAARTADNVTRGLVYAFIEQLQSGVDVMNTIADEIFGESRSRRRGADVSSDEEKRSAAMSGLAEGIHKSLEIPHRVAKRFFEELEAPSESERPAGQKPARRDRGGSVRRESTETQNRTPSGSTTKIETEIIKEGS